MIARRGVMGLFAGAATLVLGGCGILGGSSYKFRMTVEVETPQGLRTGSSVYQVMAAYRPDLQPGGKAREWAARGEAVAVDLPGGKILFALLKTRNQMREDLVQISMAALDPAFRNDIPESARRIANGDAIRSPGEVMRSDYPLLVAFGNAHDPKTVVEVDPANLAVSLGPGVKLRRIMIAVTDDAVTSGIERRLGWLDSYYAKRFDGQRFGNGASFANSLSSGAFSTEYNRR